MLVLLFLFVQTALAAGPEVYVGRLTASSAILAWGKTEGKGNTIGRGAASPGRAEVDIGGAIHTTQQSWMDVEGLRPDSDYPYAVRLNGIEIGRGTLHTWPAQTKHLRFFVIGDYGNGSSGQYEIARAMEHQFAADADSPPRFVITTGDNIYGFPLGFMTLHSGNRDQDWQSRFFEPYRPLLRSIPFYPSLGNHDGDQTENAGDLGVYLDNFFFPADPPARYYQFSIGGLADFFALDSTNQTGSAAGPQSEQFIWLSKALEASRAKWKIVYFHHPPYTAGPLHGASLRMLQHWVDLFQRSGVQMVFNGHEHNFQYARHEGIHYFVTGAGGELRTGDIARKLEAAGVEAFANERHFLEVELDENQAAVHIWGANGELHPVDKNHKPIATPIRVRVSK